MIDEKTVIQIIDDMQIDLKVTKDDFHRTFNDLGMDSLDVFNFISEVEINQKFKIDDSDFEKIKSIHDLIKLLKK